MRVRNTRRRKKRGLDDIVNSLSAGIEPVAERIGVPAAIMSGFALESMNIYNYLSSNKQIIESIGTFGPYAAAGAIGAAGLAAAAATVSSQIKKDSGPAGFIKNSLKELSGSILGRYKLEAAALASFGHLAYSQMSSSIDSPMVFLDAAKAAVIGYFGYRAAASVNAAYSETRHEAGRKSGSLFKKSGLFKAAAVAAMVATLASTPVVKKDMVSLYHDMTTVTENIMPPEEIIPTKIDKSFDEIVKNEGNKSFQEIYKSIIPGYDPSRKWTKEDILDFRKYPGRFNNEIAAFSDYYGIDKDLVSAILFTESRKHHFDADGNPVRSHTGAVGAGQHLPINIKELNRLFNYPPKKETVRWSWESIKNDPIHNIDATCATIRSLSDLFEGHVELISAAYNYGKTGIKKALIAENQEEGDEGRLYGFLWIRKHLKRGKAAVNEVSQYVKSVNTYLNIFKAHLVWPTDSRRLYLKFGKVDDDLSNMVMGIHIAPEKDGVAGDPVYAAADGYVNVAGYKENGLGNHNNGNWIEICHGEPSKMFRTQYLQLAELDVQEGDHVRAGQKIGTMGRSGKSYGVALEFLIKTGSGKKSSYFDPFDIYKANDSARTIPISEIADDSPMKKHIIRWYKVNNARWDPDSRKNLDLPADMYMIRPGDTPAKVSEMFNISRETLQEYNPDIDVLGGRWKAYDVIRLPDSYTFYEVSRGDTLSDISDMYDTSVPEIREMNRLAGSRIRVGQRLRVPKL